MVLINYKNTACTKTHRALKLLLNTQIFTGGRPIHKTVGAFLTLIGPVRRLCALIRMRTSCQLLLSFRT